MPLKLGWIGLGQMGGAHVKNIQAKCDQVEQLTVWNRDRAKCANAVALGAIAAASPREVVEQSDIVFVMLSSPEVALAIYNDPETGILAGLSGNKGIVECASLDAGTMRELHAAVISRGARFLASPVAGHSGMALNATVQFICAGDASLFGEVRAVLDALSKNKVWLGEQRGVGTAANMKLLINGLMANITASVGEALALAAKVGMPDDALFDLISNHAMNSQLIQLCGKTMRTEGGHSPPLFALRHMSKDARLAVELAGSVGQETPVSTATRDTYKAAEAQGLGDLNWTAVHERVKTIATTEGSDDDKAAAAEEREERSGDSAVPASCPWSDAQSAEEYAQLYAPTCTAHVFQNHFEAFGEQDLAKIMLDYTEESTIDVWNWASQTLERKKGRQEISEMFAGFWQGMALGGWGTMEAPVKETHDSPLKTGFLVWSAPENGIPMATDTFVYGDDFKIAMQTFAGRVG